MGIPSLDSGLSFSLTQVPDVHPFFERKPKHFVVQLDRDTDTEEVLCETFYFEFAEVRASFVGGEVELNAELLARYADCARTRSRW